MISREAKRRKNKSKNRKIVLALVFVVIIGVFNYFHINPFSRIAVAVSTPVWLSENTISQRITTFTELLKSKRTLLEENESLKQTIESEKHLVLSNKLLEEENQTLRHLLGRNDEEEVLLASVLSRPYATPYDTIVVDVGTEDGVHVGDSVLAYGDFAVGYVSKVFPNTAQITFYSSPGERTRVFIGEERIVGDAEGRGAGNFVAQLPRDAEITEGDIVVTAYGDPQVFATVEAISRNETDAFQLVRFVNPINIFSIGYVEIVLSET